eukprot:4337206-Pleurochrysis_carterae.AAC.1
MGSASGEPTAAASIAASEDGVTAACEKALLKSDCCALPFGEVKLALRPSCITALPRMLVDEVAGTFAAYRSHAIAADVQASARTYPSARLSKAKHRPVADVMPATAKTNDTAGVRMRFTPEHTER